MSDPRTLLKDLESDIDNGEITEVVRCAKRRWRMHTLSDHEQTWANQYVNSSSPVAMMQSLRAPTLAIAITDIGPDEDETPLTSVQTFFMEEYEKQNGAPGADIAKVLSGSNPYARQYFFAEQMYMWLAKRNSVFVEALWGHYSKLLERRRAAQDAMGKY